MNRWKKLCCVVSVGVLTTIFIGCSSEGPSDEGSAASSKKTTPNGHSNERELGLSVQKEPYGTTGEGRDIDRFYLANSHGLTVSLISYGAIVTSVVVPDRDGDFQNITLGFETLNEYETNAPYFGAICGRYANRIAGGKFSIEGIEYSLATNNAPNHLHGGRKGFNKAVWDAREFTNEDSVGVELTYVSPDGEEGYPGELRTTVVYTLTDENELRIDYTAVADKTTTVNLTNHCYWNLAGYGDVLDHRLTLHCDKYLPVDETLIPTGELKSVPGTPMDFTEPKPIGSRIDRLDGGYDHCYVFEANTAEGPKRIARVHDPKSGRVMEIFTTEPGVQLYTGNFLDGSESCGGFGRRQGFCLECQHFPDSPNQPGFPNTVLQPGEIYKQTTVHRFSIEK